MALSCVHRVIARGTGSGNQRLLLKLCAPCGAAYAAHCMRARMRLVNMARYEVHAAWRKWCCRNVTAPDSTRRARAGLAQAQFEARLRGAYRSMLLQVTPVHTRDVGKGLDGPGLGGASYPRLLAHDHCCRCRTATSWTGSASSRCTTSSCRNWWVRLLPPRSNWVTVRPQELLYVLGDDMRAPNIPSLRT